MLNSVCRNLKINTPSFWFGLPKSPIRQVFLSLLFVSIEHTMDASLFICKYPKYKNRGSV